MQAFDERSTISAPVEVSHSGAPRTVSHDPGNPGDGVVGLWVYDQRREIGFPGGVGRVVIGAGDGCDVIVEDAFLSSRHCAIERWGKRVIVRDCGSKNGTFINGNRIVEGEVVPGTRVTAGRSAMLVLGAAMKRQPRAVDSLIGRDRGFRAALDRALRAAATDYSVLIVGETGTGKELVARAIHEASTRGTRPFVAVNCGAIPAPLVESELFGHERGAFTGATCDRDGLFVQAHGGTLFLDEVGELPLDQQPPLLRALEQRTVRRVGGLEDRAVDVRVVSATNRLDGLGQRDAHLRLDVFHRLATIVVRLPPLRARQRDIPLLIEAFLRELAPSHGRRTLSKRTMRALIEYPWPGNVRELRQAILRAVTLCDQELTVEVLLPDERRVSPQPKARARRKDPIDELVVRSRGPVGTAAPSYGDIVRDVIEGALRKHGSYRRAAVALGISKSTLADRAKRYGVLWPIPKR